MSGGIITVALGLFERFSGRSVPLWVYACVLIFFAFVACYLAWRAQCYAVADAKNTINELSQSVNELKHSLSYEREQNMPKFEGIIGSVASGNIDGGAQAFVMLSVRNSGAPSIVEGFPLHVKSNKVDIKGIPIHIPDGYQLFGENDAVIARFSRQHILEEKIEKPIERGGRVEGWLMYIFPNLKAEMLRGVDTEFSIDFRDVHGQV